MTQARVLYELAHRDQQTATDLGKQLALDAGYLSRILRGFERRKLLRKMPSPDDARRSLLSLTDRGRTMMAPLEAAANREAQSMIGSLSTADQRRLVAAMETIENLLGGGSQKPAAYVIRQHEPGDIGWLISRHGAIYAHEYGLNENFEALVAEVSAAFLRSHDPRRERCWIAELEGERIGSIMLCCESEKVAKLRVLLVEPQARGLGVGRRLVEECIRFAKQAGYCKVVLWTANVLTAARAIYEQAGFRLVAEEPHRMFGPEWIGEHWELEL